MVKNGTLLILAGGTKKVAHKVSQTGGSKALFRVHFAACPGTKPVADTIITAEDLAGTINGSLAGAEHLLFGYKGDAFRGANGMHLHVVDVVGAAGREGSISKVSVMTWATGETRPDLSTAPMMEMEDFLRDFHGEPLSKPVAESISVGEMPSLARVLQASDLMVKNGSGLAHGVADRVALLDMEQLLSAVLEEAVVGRVKASSATARLEGLLKGKTALREGAGWKHARDTGTLDHLSGKQAGSFFFGRCGSPNCQHWSRAKGEVVEPQKAARRSAVRTAVRCIVYCTLTLHLLPPQPGWAFLPDGNLHTLFRWVPRRI